MIAYEISSEEILQETRKKKILECADYMIDYNLTVRQVSEECVVPRSTVHKWLTCDLRYLDAEKYILCKKIMWEHKKCF